MFAHINNLVLWSFLHPLFLSNRFFSQIPVINDDLPFKILSGSVIVKPNIKLVRGSTVVFDDDSTVDDVSELCYPHLSYIMFSFKNNWDQTVTSNFSQVDTIVFATGYNYDFPYLPSNALYKSGHRVGLYKHVFPPNLEHPTLAILGFIHSDGSIMPQAEMQARFVTRVFKGEVTVLFKLTVNGKNLEICY